MRKFVKNTLPDLEQEPHITYFLLQGVFSTIIKASLHEMKEEIIELYRNYDLEYDANYHGQGKFYENEEHFCSAFDHVANNKIILEAKDYTMDIDNTIAFFEKELTIRNLHNIEGLDHGFSFFSGPAYDELIENLGNRPKDKSW